MSPTAAVGATGRPVTVVLAAIAIAATIAACDRTSDKSAAAKPELTPTPPAIGAPPADPAAVMPPKASAVLEPSAPAADKTANGSDPSAKEPMSKAEESTAMPKPGQANDHSTLATDGKQ